MTKGLKLGALSFVASALLSTTAFAGTIKQTDGTTAYATTTKASELATGASFTMTADQLGMYIPSDIVLTTLSNPTFNYTMTNGTMTLDTAHFTYYVVEIADIALGLQATDKVVAAYTAGSGTKTVAFGATGPQVSNGGHYVIVESDDTAAPVAVDATTLVSNLTTPVLASNVDYQQTVAGASDTLTVKLGQGDSQTISDIATAQLLNASKQLCASVTGVQKNIDPLDEFKSFNLAGAACGTGAQTTTDTIVVKFNADQKDINAVGLTDKAMITVYASPALPTGTVATVADSTSVDAGDVCTAAAGATSFKCTASSINLTDFNANEEETVTITLTVDGTHAISRTVFTADVEYDFANTGATDYLSSTDNALLVSANANSWEYRGTTIATPSINANNDTNTQVKINNDSTDAARVFWTLTDDAGNTVEAIEVASSEGNTGLAAGTSNTWLANALRTAAQAIKPTFGEKFRGHAVVTSETDISAVSVMMINGGRDRVIPLVTTTTAP